jgi:hypothetical protein
LPLTPETNRAISEVRSESEVRRLLRRGRWKVVLGGLLTATVAFFWKPLLVGISTVSGIVTICEPNELKSQNKPLQTYCSYIMPSHSPQSGASQETHDLSRPPRDGFSKILFLGEWVGKWDGIWAVVFVVNHIEEQTVSIEYKVEEQLGQPMMSKNIACKLLDVKNILCEKGIGLGIELDSDNTEKATARILSGNGAVRTASLTKTSGP